MNETLIAPGVAEIPEDQMLQGSETSRMEEVRGWRALIPIEIYFCEGEVFYFAQAENGASENGASQ